MAHLGVVSDVWTGCATDPACCCNELTTAPLTVTLQPNGVADADEWLGMAHACPSLGSPLLKARHGPSMALPSPWVITHELADRAEQAVCSAG